MPRTLQRTVQTEIDMSSEQCIIQVLGEGRVLHPAERATVHLQALGRNNSSQQDASETVRSAAQAVQNLVHESFQSDAPSGRGAADSPISQYSMASLKTAQRSERLNSGSNATETVYTAQVDFAVTFRDFEALDGFATTASAMGHVSVSKVEWLLTDDTLGAFAGQARTLAARDAKVKAYDFAKELHRIPDSRLEQDVRAIHVEDKSRAAQQGTRPHARGYSAGVPLSRVSTTALSFVPEDVTIKVDVNVHFKIALVPDIAC